MALRGGEMLTTESSAGRRECITEKKRTMKKEELIRLLESTKEAVIKEDVTTLIQSIDRLKIDSRFSDPLGTYASDIIRSAITEHIEQKRLDALRVKRSGEYGSIVSDCYKIVDGVLMRNGTNAKWTSLGKLYQAYKQIKKIEK